MQNEHDQSQKPLSRQQRHYLRHSDEILKLRKLRRRKKKQAQVKPDQDPPIEKLAKPRKSIILSNLLQRLAQLSEQLTFEKLLAVALVCLCTGFLIWQSTQTLETMEGHGALFKAIVCEVVLVTVAMLQPSRFHFKALKFFVLSALCILTLLNALGGPLNQFSEGQMRLDTKKKEVTILGHSIAEKRDILSRYLATDRISGARRVEQEISSLSSRLADIEREKLDEKSETILLMGFAIAILLRVSILLANILFSNRLGELIGEKKSAPKSNARRPHLILVHG